MDTGVNINKRTGLKIYRGFLPILSIVQVLESDLELGSTFDSPQYRCLPNYAHSLVY